MVLLVKVGQLPRFLCFSNGSSFRRFHSDRELLGACLHECMLDLLYSVCALRQLQILKAATKLRVVSSGVLLVDVLFQLPF